jgi:TPR repeat protein
MFRLTTGRHRLGASGDRGEAALKERVAALDAELATWKALAERRARAIGMLEAGIAALILALGVALAVQTTPVRQAVGELVQALGFAGPVKGTDAAAAAYGKGDYATALRQVRPLAEQGDARAQSLLGRMYYLGRGVPQDDIAAANWFRLAANQGDAPAQFNLGVMYAEGRGVPQDHAEAAKWYRLAADRGHAQAQYNLALAYAKGEGVSQDYVRAHMWFNLAAAHFPASEVRNHELAVRNRGLVANKMTREQLAEAQNLAREWKARF